eukprot:TRINITY_DN455_c0_g1_i2.p1 TRINITY_DN455_c0_g1~~TRINITY_DN455_c0_g1_i2.p1  ORF type:complete len:257 (-),score=89.75 TRINITY_DN455_c0_g1_i2:34-702(-)
MHMQQMPPMPPTIRQQQQQHAASRLQMQNFANALDALAVLDHVYIKQRIEPLECLCGCETQNNYDISNKERQQLFHVTEKSGCCTRICLGNCRPWEMIVTDINKRPALRLHRPMRCVYRCCIVCCSCCAQELNVFDSAHQDRFVGKIEQQCSCCDPLLHVKDAGGNVLYKIVGPTCACRCCSDVRFKVLHADADNDRRPVSTVITIVDCPSNAINNQQVTIK